jgi:hypothetical protein
MAVLVIESWSDERKWASERSWNLAAFTHRLALCTKLHGTELKRIARLLKNKELMEVEVIGKEQAEPLIHILESLGAKIAIK